VIDLGGVICSHAIGYNKLIEEYISFLRAKLAFHKQHAEFNGTLAASGGTLG
jgi:ANTH domain